MYNLLLGAAILALFLSLPELAKATDCNNWVRFSTNAEYLKPISVPAKKIGAHLTESIWSEGIRFDSELKGRELWLDVTYFPGNTTAAGAARAIMQVGRLADESFDQLILSEEDIGLFAISEGKLRDIGCRFIWGREGGENPIALMRDLFSALEHYGTGMPLSADFTGSLLGDTSLALDLNNKILVPGWVMSAVQ